MLADKVVMRTDFCDTADTLVSLGVEYVLLGVLGLGDRRDFAVSFLAKVGVELD